MIQDEQGRELTQNHKVRGANVSISLQVLPIHSSVRYFVHPMTGVHRLTMVVNGRPILSKPAMFLLSCSAHVLTLQNNN